ncbi:WD40-repeat-containing domain [Pseudocohnilembus persalinus]|uniref:WD40-repeat-containing domain n=1 Tax=Pseudocohnilembus persalinus TaxID=266149 RepID=A0A0V0R113_PSEPJ|nr:WD40-repeat-containing domain [Pseudocohnilembus persalinus]|eukprot:KRX08238.1 WD40-repeat-containing domain [Pseudocohnilembus persalinus]
MQNNHQSSKILGNSNIQGQSQVQNNIQPIDENNWAKSQVLQAIMLKPELGQYHQMIDSTINEKYQIIATGSLTGDIILWDYSQDQSKICLFTVHLDNRVRLWNIQDGRCFNISSHQMFKGQINYAIPLKENYSRFILLGGTRGILYVFDTWTMKEISILQLSKEDVIFQICGIQIDYKNKYIYVIDSNNEIYQISYQDFDKIEYNIYENFVKQQNKYDKEIQQSKLQVEYKLKLQHMEKPTDLLYDEKNDLLIIPVEQNIYFYKKSNLIEKMVQQKEEDELKKQRAKQFQLEFMKFNETFFKGNNYTQQLEDIDKKKKEDEKNKKPEVLLNYLILQNYAKYQYQDIKIVYHNGQQFYLISTKEGSAFVLSYSSLLKLFEVIELAKPDDVNFSFPGFSFYKSSNQCYAQVTFKMVEIVTRAEGDSNNPKLEEYLQKQVININQVTKQNKYSNLFSFDLLNSNYESYNLAEFIDKNIEKIDVILGSYKIQLQQIQEQDEKQQDLAKIHENYYKNPFSKEEMEEQSLIELKSNGYILICKIEKKVALNSSLLELNTTGISLTTKVPEICSFKFKNLTIGPNLKNSFNIFHPKFKEDFKQAFEDHIQEDIVTITQTGFIDEKDPIFFVGTSSGMVYAFPLLYSLNKNYYQFFKLNLKSHQEEQNKIGIVFMQLINNNLIISQENGFLTVLNLENLILIQQIDVQNQEQQQQNQNEKESAQEKTFVINDLSNQIILQSKLNMPIKRIKKIQILESLLKECQDKELIQLGKQTINNQFALIQMNNNITIISTEKKEVEYELRDPGQGSIYIVFYHFIMDYYVILTSNGYLHFWSLGSGRFERTELVNNYKQIFDIESLIYKNQQGIVDTNRFYYFEKQQPQISQYHSILEFQNRYHESVVNMFEENSKIEKTHNRHGFETLGDLSKIQLEDENLSHLIWSLLERIHLQNLSLGKKVGMNILKVHMNPQRTENYYNSNNILYVDCKFHNSKIQELFENSNDKSEHKLFSYMPYLFPWGANAKLDEEATKKLRIKRSVIQYEVGVIGLANCFSFSMKKAYQQQQMEKQQDLEQLVGQNKNESQEIKEIDEKEIKNTNQDKKQIEQSQIYNKESNQFSISSFVTSNISVAILLNLHQRRTIIHISKIDLKEFFSLIKTEITQIENHQLYPCSVIDIIKNFIKQSFADAQKHLPFFIEIILKSLDPNQPSQRKICHQSANTALQTICLQYQNVSFLGQEQKLAVGAYNQTGQSQIIIYDLRQASKWLLLEGHQGPVAAVKFDSKGKHIASFSFVDKQIKIWKVGQTGFFGSILNMSSKKIKSFNINNSFKDINKQKTTLQWSNDDKFINLQVGDLPPFQFKL